MLTNHIHGRVRSLALSFLVLVGLLALAIAVLLLSSGDQARAVAPADPTPPADTDLAFLPLLSSGRPDVPPAPADPLVYNCEGVITNTLWLTATFGPVGWERGPDGRAELTELHCNIGPSTLVVFVEDVNGDPVEGVTVVRYWPDAPPLPPELATWHDRGVYGPTNAEGSIGFAMGGGDYYWLPSAGVSAVWVGGAPGSDLMHGLGMLGETEHQHLDSVFRLPDGWQPARIGFTPGAIVREVDYLGRRLPVVEWPAPQR